MLESCADSESWQLPFTEAAHAARAVIWHFESLSLLQSNMLRMPQALTEELDAAREGSRAAAEASEARAAAASSELAEAQVRGCHLEGFSSGSFRNLTNLRPSPPYSGTLGGHPRWAP